MIGTNGSISDNRNIYPLRGQKLNSFDETANRYQEALQHNLRFVPGGTDYYYENRAKLARAMRLSTAKTDSILDFGGGIGLAIPHLRRKFPHSKIYIYDSSEESVARAAQENESVSALTLEQLRSQKFDIIFVAGVIHHISPDERAQTLEILRDSLNHHGTICIFELNPLNPVTRRLVANCPFDEDASLISKASLTKVISEIDGLGVKGGGYTVFMPPILKALWPAERLLRWLPLGAQYYLKVHGGRN